jgi:hypothetical protein
MYARMIEPVASNGVGPELFCFFGGTPKNEAACIPSGSTPYGSGDCALGGQPC